MNRGIKKKRVAFAAAAIFNNIFIPVFLIVVSQFIFYMEGMPLYNHYAGFPFVECYYICPDLQWWLLSWLSLLDCGFEVDS